MSLVLVAPSEDGLRLTPAAPLGPWALRPFKRILRAQPPGTRVTVSLARAPVGDAPSVAGVLWLEREAQDRGLELELVAADPVSAEMVTFAGVVAPVRLGAATAPAPARRKVS